MTRVKLPTILRSHAGGERDVEGLRLRARDAEVLGRPRREGRPRLGRHPCSEKDARREEGRVSKHDETLAQGQTLGPARFLAARSKVKT